MKLDAWQEEVLKHEGSMAIRSGRQVGKSFIIAKKAVQFALKNKGTITLVIAASQRQSSYIFEKMKGEFTELERKGRKLIKKRPTLTRIQLINGSTIYSYPAGVTGATIRGLSLDLLIVDEADYVNELVWLAVVPMMAVSQQTRGFGHMILISTINPYRDTGFFKEKFDDPKFKTWKISSEDCTRIPVEFLAREKARLPHFEYQAEYCGAWTERLTQYFPEQLIDECMNFKFWDKKITQSRRFYLGIDIAGKGRDEEAFVCGEMIGDKIKNVHNEILETSRLQDTVRMTDKLDQKLFFNRIFIDSSGIGAGYEDIMKEKFGRRLIGINNASKSKDKQHKILKEDLYSNVLRLMEMRKLSLIQDDRMKKSLKSIKIIEGKIGGSNAHLAEALVRMCWCAKNKGLKLFVG